MDKFILRETGIAGMVVLHPRVFSDDRGFFLESFHEAEYRSLGLPSHFVQENHSCSEKGVLRGMHYQSSHAQGKLVRVVCGSAYDAAVDLRPGSPTWGRYYGLILSGDNRILFYIPEGFAHGFLALENNTHFLYKTTDYYYPEYESGFAYNDPFVKIPWPRLDVPYKLSPKDAKLPFLALSPQSTISFEAMKGGSF